VSVFDRKEENNIGLVAVLRWFTYVSKKALVGPISKSGKVQKINTYLAVYGTCLRVPTSSILIQPNSA